MYKYKLDKNLNDVLYLLIEYIVELVNGINAIYVLLIQVICG